MQHDNTKSMVESGVLTAVAMVLILLCYYLPGFVLVGIFIWPIPITLIYIRHGAKYGILSLVATLILAAITTDPLSAVGLVSIYGVLGFVLGFCIKSKKRVSVTIMIMAGATLLSTLGVFQVFQAVTGQDFIAQGIQAMNKGFDTAISMYKSMGIKEEDLKMLSKSIPSAQVINMWVPAAILVYSVTASFLCYIITQKVLKRFRYTIAPVKPVSQWYIPSKASFVVISIFGISLLLMYSGMENGQKYFVNANLIFIFTFTINAVAFLAWFMKKREVHNVLSVFIIIFCIMSPIVAYLYLLGIFDYIFDFRKLDPSRKRPNN